MANYVAFSPIANFWRVESTFFDPLVNGFEELGGSLSRDLDGVVPDSDFLGNEVHLVGVSHIGYREYLAGNASVGESIPELSIKRWAKAKLGENDHVLNIVSRVNAFLFSVVVGGFFFFVALV